MARRLRVKWCTNLTLEGCGEDLTAKFKGELQRGRGARALAVEITLELSRCAVGTFLEQIRQMHERDRARIAGEIARIEREKTRLGG